jgi:putative heme-binding domain-containing protein
LLTPSYLAAADASHGRALFAKSCATCHVLFDDGRKIGPDLTGSQRANLDYVLENLLDPSAVVAREYRVSIVQTTGGRVITGMVLEEAAQTITVQTPNERLIVPRSEIDEQVQSPLSMMPEGLLQTLSETDIRDLVAYLASPQQVPKPNGTAPTGEGK